MAEIRELDHVINQQAAAPQEALQADEDNFFPINRLCRYIVYIDMEVKYENRAIRGLFFNFSQEKP